MTLGYDSNVKRETTQTVLVRIGAKTDLELEARCDIDMVIEIYTEIENGRIVNEEIGLDAVTGIDKVLEVFLNGTLLPEASHNAIEDIIMADFRAKGDSESGIWIAAYCALFDIDTST